MNDSPGNLKEIQWRLEERVEHWNRRQNAGAMEAPGSNIRKDSPDEPKRTHQQLKQTYQEPVDTMVRGESTGVTRAIRGKLKWQCNGTEDSPEYIKFSHSM